MRGLLPMLQMIGSIAGRGAVDDLLGSKLFSSWYRTNKRAVSLIPAFR